MTPTHPPRTHVGYDYLVAALAEFYTASGFGATAAHRDRPTDREQSFDRPRAPVGAGDPPGEAQGAIEATPVFIAERIDDGPHLESGQSNQVTLSVYGTTPVHIRDRLPDGWSVEAADAHTTYTDDGARYVEFRAPILAGIRSYHAVPPADDTGGDASFGPLEFSPDGGDSWHLMEGTTSTTVVPRGESCPR